MSSEPSHNSTRTMKAILARRLVQRTFGQFMISVLIGVLTLSSSAVAQVPGGFTGTGPMNSARYYHAATLLSDGRILITGGCNGNASLASAEIYDPATGMFVPAGDMTAPRCTHTATLLLDGRVLIAGGFNSTAELYDPATGTFTRTGDMLNARVGHSATLLPDGRVLIAGGTVPSSPYPTVAPPELYDLTRGTFSTAGAYAGRNTMYRYAGGPIWPKAVLLKDGTVLLAANNPAELYDPAKGEFRETGTMVQFEYRFGMYWHSATLLADATVLVAGGVVDDMSCNGSAANTEIYDPLTGTFSASGRMTEPRDLHTATLLNDGKVLIAGGGSGWCRTGTSSTAEVYDPATRQCRHFGRRLHHR
jgi:hypothetical protein